MKINFNKPCIFPDAIKYIIEAIDKGHTAGDGYYTKLCHKWLEDNIGAKKALLTHSCTAALEMAAILLDLDPGDEVIMPSFTFVSTANAFVLRGAVPVFVDIRPDTLNIDENLIESAITEKTRAIVVVHYAGVACEMDKILEIAKKYNLEVIEDDAQGICSRYKGQNIGTFGSLSAISFHETKNIISGEGGALLINDEKYIERAEIIREKGTNRSKFFRGEIDKYTWVDIGSSYLPSDIIAAYLYSQFEKTSEITQKRLEVWHFYHKLFEKYESAGFIKRPQIPDNCDINGHIFYVLFNSLKERTSFIEFMKSNNVNPVFHYIPLHSSPAGMKFGRTATKMNITDKISETLVRMPMFYELNDENLSYIANITEKFFDINFK